MTSSTRIADEKIVKQHIKKTNTALRGIGKANRKLFDVVKDAYLDLKDFKNSWKRYRLDIDCDSSTINKIVKVVESEFVMENLESLPSAWSILYAISQLEKSEEKKLATALEDGTRLTAKTLKEILEIAGRSADTKAVTASDPVVKYDSTTFDESQLQELRTLLEKLEPFGFKVKDIAVKTSGADKTDDAVSASDVEQKEAA